MLIIHIGVGGGKQLRYSRRALLRSLTTHEYTVPQHNIIIYNMVATILYSTAVCILFDQNKQNNIILSSIIQ